MVRPLSTRPFVSVLFLLGNLVFVCRPGLAENRPGLAKTLKPSSAVPLESSGITTLRQIEDRVLPLPLVAGVSRHESLNDYYMHANVPLYSRLDEAIRAFNSGKPSPFRAMTILAGSAGVGKTFVKRMVYRESIPDDEVWKFDVRELFGELATQGLAELKPDLVYGDQVINRLLSLTPTGREEFTRLLESKSVAFVVIDSLDEVHPDDYSFVLSELERIALHGNREFIHVVVFARPLAIRDYWRDRSSAGIPNGLQGFVLNPPDFRTTGDLLVSTWNYDCWKYGLCRVEPDGKSRPMSLPDFRQWCDHDFVTTGDFADVSYQENCSMRPQVRDEVRQWSQQHRVVAAVLPNLAGNTMFREIVDEIVDHQEAFDERAFMDEFFEKWLERDTQSDDRPSRLKPQHLDAYSELLEAVAAKYVDENRVSRLGYFDVMDDDQVVVEHDGETVTVFVRRLLNRSGLVDLDPMLPEAARYRFEPFWFHRLLLQRHQERQSRSQPHVAARSAAPGNP